MQCVHKCKPDSSCSGSHLSASHPFDQGSVSATCCEAGNHAAQGRARRAHPHGILFDLAHDHLREVAEHVKLVRIQVARLAVDDTQTAQPQPAARHQRRARIKPDVWRPCHQRVVCKPARTHTAPICP